MVSKADSERLAQPRRLCNQKTAYLALWDERFAGWPRFEANPAGKDNVASTFFVPVSEYKLVPLSVREYGKNIVLTF